MPLYLDRKVGQVITVSGPTTIRVVEIHRRHVRVELTAERAVRILRGELKPNKNSSENKK